MGVLPSFDIDELKNKVDNLQDLEGHVDLRPSEFVSLDTKALKACLKGRAATIMEQELNMVKAIIEAVVGSLDEAFKLAQKAKGKLTTLKELSTNALALVSRTE